MSEHDLFPEPGPKRKAAALVVGAAAVVCLLYALARFAGSDVGGGPILIAVGALVVARVAWRRARKGRQDPAKKEPAEHDGPSSDSDS